MPGETGPVALTSKGGQDDRAVLILAHGAGAPMDSPFMAEMAGLLEGYGVAVKRFEFDYMAARRTTGRKAPPPRAEKLLAEYQQVIDGETASRIIIGGKSLGGRVASMIAQHNFEAGRVRGLVCLGYPFHPPGKPERLRTAHLAEMTCPALIVQGENDPFGTRTEVAGYDLAGSIAFAWIEQGNHDLVPPKRTGITADAARARVAQHVYSFICNT